MHTLIRLLSAVMSGVVVTVASPATAQSPSPVDRFAVEVWNTDHGLPQNSVNAIAQTPDGYLWLGTSGGLARFDGIRFMRIERRDSVRFRADIDAIMDAEV